MLSDFGCLSFYCKVLYEQFIPFDTVCNALGFSELKHVLGKTQLLVKMHVPMEPINESACSQGTLEEMHVPMTTPQ